MPESEIFSVDMYRDKMIGSPDRLFLKNERRTIKNEKKVGESGDSDRSSSGHCFDCLLCIRNAWQ